MIISRRWIITLVCGFVAMMGLSQQVRAAVSLSDLINNNQSVLVGNSLLFDQFSFTKTGLAPSASSVNVVALEDMANGVFGIRFQNGFSDLPGNGPSTMNIGYRVTSVKPGLGLNWASLAGNPAVFGTDAAGFLTITESFASLPTVLTIFDKLPGSTQLLATANLPVISPSLQVDLAVIGDIAKGGGSESMIDTTFKTAPVPEPGSMLVWLGTMMIVGIVTLSRQRDVWSRVSTHVSSAWAKSH